MYIKPPSTAPYTVRQLRLDNPDTSFPAEPSDEMLAMWGIVPVEVQPAPDHDPRTHQAVLLPPVEDNGNWMQRWELRDVPAEDARQAFKAQRAEAVQNIAVTTQAGNTFGGGEESQTRMARAIVALPDGATVPWVLADNSIIQATAGELREALALSGAEQARLWVQ